MKPCRSEELNIHSHELLKASFLFEAAIHPVRRHLLQLLTEEHRLPAAIIYRKLHLSKALCIQHLSILCGVGLVLRQANGEQLLYAVNYEKLDELHAAAEALST